MPPKLPSNVSKLPSANSGDAEWLGDIRPLPIAILDDQEQGFADAPSILLWMTAEGFIAGNELGTREELLQRASMHLHATLAKPRVDEPVVAPDRLRITDQQLAKVIANDHPLLDISEAPTPELDEVIEGFTEHLLNTDADHESYLVGDTEPAAMSAFFDAAADCYRSKPWEWIPDDSCLIGLNCAELGLKEAIAVVIGQQRESFGILLFENLHAYEDFVIAADDFESDSDEAITRMPKYLAISFEPGKELPAAMRKEVARHRWQVVDKDAYPTGLVFLEGGLLPAAAATLPVLESLARLIATLKDEADNLYQAWGEAKGFDRCLEIEHHKGLSNIDVWTPARQHPEHGVALLDQLAALELSTDGVIDYEKREQLEKELLTGFDNSEIAVHNKPAFFTPLFLDLAANYLGRTIGSLRWPDVEELLFELVPRKAAIEPKMAEECIDELNDFFQFLADDHRLYRAISWIERLDDDAINDFGLALASPENFGLAKSIVSNLSEAELDDLPFFDDESSNILLPEVLQAEGSRKKSTKQPTAEDKRKEENRRKTKRKAAKKARKKNR